MIDIRFVKDVIVIVNLVVVFVYGSSNWLVTSRFCLWFDWAILDYVTLYRMRGVLEWFFLRG